MLSTKGNPIFQYFFEAKIKQYALNRVLNKRIFLHVIHVLINTEIILHTPSPNYCGYVEKIWVSATIKVWRLCGNNRWNGKVENF